MTLDDSTASLCNRFQRSAAVGAGCAADIAINYPLWIVAKRMGVGIAAVPPTLPELYKGGGSLWISLGPSTLPGGLGIDRELASSVFAGAFAAATFCAQVE